jgi:hypothetical protein
VNKQYDLSLLESWDWRTVNRWDECMITGGEPMLFPFELLAFLGKWRALERPTLCRCKLIVYTAFVRDMETVIKVLKASDGITLTLHEQLDVDQFEILNRELMLREIYDKSLRLNVFKGVRLPKTPLPLWEVKKDIVWLKDCPLAEDELYMLR